MADDTTVKNLEKRLQELEKELQDSQKTAAGLQSQLNIFNAIISNTTLPIYLKSADFTYIFINKQFEMLSGTTNEEIKGKHDYEVFPKPIADMFRDQDEEVLKCKEMVKFEETVSLPAGNLTFMTSKFPVFDKDGSIEAVGGTCTDITHLKKAEKSLCESEEKLKNLFDSCSAGIMTYSLEDDGRLVFTGFNQAANDILGVDCSQYIGRTIEEAFPPLAETEVPDRYRRACIEGIPWQTEQINYEDEHIKGAFEVNAFQTAPGMMATMFRDITSRKQADEKLRQSEERFRSLVENISLGVSMLNPRMEILAMNRQMQQWFPDVDVSKNPICHHAFNDPPSEECCSYCPVVRSFSDGLIHEAVTDTPTEDGIKHYRVLSTPIKDSDGSVTHVIEVVEDITERLKMEEELHRSKKIESIGILAGGIAHDFNNLLTAIMGNISLAKRFIETDSKAYERITATEKATHRAQDLTYQLLTFSRGGAPILKSVAIDQMIHDSINFALSGTNISYSLTADSELWPVIADEGQVGQVMQNITTNAVEVMPHGGKLHISIKNYEIVEQNGLSLQPGKYLKITIQDQGPGISKEHQEKIFDPFYSTKSNGNGLGLAICFSIIKKHKGLITFETGEDSGTCFDIYLPASEKLPEPITDKKEDVIHGKGRILVMDDNESVLETASEMLCHVGYQVELAKDGIEAFNFYRKAMEAEQTYDVVILDLTVPDGMGGREAMQNILELDPDAKGIVSSGYSNAPVMTEYKKHGFSGMVKKPYRLGNLSRTVSEVIHAIEEI
jgi:PAS domain S-box-containing protein